MAEFERAMTQLLLVTMVEAVVFSAFLLTAYCMVKFLVGHVAFRTAAEQPAELAAHRDTVLDMGQNTNEGLTNKPQLGLTETEEAIF